MNEVPLTAGLQAEELVAYMAHIKGKRKTNNPASKLRQPPKVKNHENQSISN
ncbi:hypothetical protein ACJJI5_11715 [Microbulbifer sp. EKSA008]|uniref:hypothetical protein n=1 Tax=unclassified Microbulbifer TaxID=2619833 RepID=UPI00403A12FD